MSSDQKIEASSLPVSTIKGVGEKLSSTLSKLGIITIEDLLFHFPIGYQDRTTLKKIAELEPNQDFVVQGEIEKVSQTFVPRKMLLVKIKDNTGHIYLRFFYYFPGLRNVFKEGHQYKLRAHLAWADMALKLFIQNMKSYKEMNLCRRYLLNTL